MGVVVSLDDARERKAQRRRVLAIFSAVIGAAMLAIAARIGS